jgi:hypothetical protein
MCSGQVLSCTLSKQTSSPMMTCAQYLSLSLICKCWSNLSKCLLNVCSAVKQDATFIAAITLALSCRRCCCLQEASPEDLAAIQELQLHTQPDTNGWNALHYAAAAHQVKLVQQLLEIGADPAAPNKHGLMPLHLACMGRVTSEQQLSKLRSACELTADMPPHLQVCSDWIIWVVASGLQDLSLC